MPEVTIPPSKPNKHPSKATNTVQLIHELQHWIDNREYLGFDATPLRKAVSLLKSYMSMVGSIDIMGSMHE